jgi:hypothetical protein
MAHQLRSLKTWLQEFDAGIVLAATLTLFAIQSLLATGLPTTADLAIHLYRTLEFERAWAPGVLLPRWAPNLAYGYGYPLFVFAPPLPYLLAAGLHITGLTLGQAFKGLLILCMLLYSVGMYLLARDLLRSTWAGLIAAVAFTYAPFALREALLYGGNVPQYLAIGLFPWGLWAAARAVRSRYWGWVVLTALFYAAIILSHLFHALVYSPVLAGFLGLLLLFTLAARPQRSLWMTLRPLLALPLGLLLSAFFWLPAFVERSYTRAQAEVYLEKSPFFIRYPYWSELVAWIIPLDERAANPYVPLTLGVVSLLLALVGLAAVVTRLWQAGRHRDQVRMASLSSLLFLALVAVTATFLTLPASRPIWELVSVLQVAEFPWRLLGLVNLGLAPLVGAALLLLPSRYRQWTAPAVIVVQLLAVAPYLYPVVSFTNYRTPTLTDQITYERSSQSIGTTTLGEYLPLAVSNPPNSSPMVETYLRNQLPDRLDRDSLPAETAAELLDQTAVTHRYRLTGPQPVTLRLNQFNYPGWLATLNGQDLEIKTEPESGLILLEVPAGDHIVTLHFGETPLRLAAIAISAITLLGLVLYSLLTARAVPDQAHQPPSPRFNARSPRVWLSAGLIAIGALAVTPQLRPFFTVASPPDRVLAAARQTDYRFGNGIQLVGYSLNRETVNPGDYLQVVLYWQTDSAPYRVNLQPFVHLDKLDTFETLAGSTNYTPGDVTTETNMPTFHWDNSRYVRDEHDITIPDDAAALPYAVRVGLVDPDDDGRRVSLTGDAGDTLWLETINVQPRQAPPALAQTMQATFVQGDDSLQLVGYELTGQDTEQLAFTLAWQRGSQLTHDYVVFTQLLDSNDRLVAGFDQPPLGGAYPTSTWPAGQPILERRTIPLNDVPAGEYRLIAGLYRPDSGQRMLTTDGHDFVEVTTITVP